MIDFTLSPEHQELQEMYRKFAEERVRPLAHEMDENEKFDMGLLKEMQECGFFGIPFEEKYGGAGSDVLSYVLCMEEMSKVDASTGITLSVHTSLCASSINEFATEEQKEKWLRPLVDGSKIGCFGLTEPGAGSDVARRPHHRCEGRRRVRHQRREDLHHQLRLRRHLPGVRGHR